MSGQRKTSLTVTTARILSKGLGTIAILFVAITTAYSSGFVTFIGDGRVKSIAVSTSAEPWSFRFANPNNYGVVDLGDEPENLRHKAKEAKEAFRDVNGKYDVATLALLLMAGLTALGSTIITSNLKVSESDGAVLQNEELVRLAMASISDAVIATDQLSRVTYLNAAAEALTGWTFAEAAGQPLVEVVQIKNGLERGPTHQSILSTKDGREISIEECRSTVLDKSGGLRAEVIVLRDISGQRAVETALLESKASLEMRSRIFDITLSSITDFAYTFDRAGRFIYINKPLLELWGLELHQAVGKDFHDLKYPKDLAGRLQQQIEQVFSTGEIVRDETPYTSPTGAGGYYEYIFNPVFDVDGNVEIVAGSTRDITDRKLAEDRVKQLSKQNFEVLESITDAFFAVDSDWRFTYVNRNAEILLEKGTDELIGKTMWEMYPNLSGTEFEQVYRRAASERAKASITAFYPDHNRWYEVHIYPAHNGLTFYFRNATERKQAEETLRASEERYRGLFNSIDEGFCIIEVIFNANSKPVDYRFLEVSPSFVKQTGLENAVGKTIRELNPSQEDHWFEKYGEIALTGVPMRFKNRARGLDRWFDVYAFRIGDEEQRHVAVLFNDVSEREDSDSRMALLAETGEIIQTTEDPAELFYSVSEAVGKHFDMRRCFFNEIDLESDLEIVHHHYCDGAESVEGTHRVSSYSPLSSNDMRMGKTVVNFDSQVDPRSASLYEKVYEPAGERSYVAVPLMRDGHWVSSLWMSDNKPRNWSDGDINLIVTIAERTWLAAEKLRSETALRESEERFAKAFNSSPLAITITSLRTGKLVEVNETFVNMTGYAREEVIGKTSLDLGLWVTEQDREIELSRVRNEGKLQDAEYRFQMRDGTQIVGLLSAELLELNGEPCSLTVIQDITERKTAEEALRASEEKFRIFSDTAPALIWFNDAEGHCRYVNRRFLEFTGKTFSEIEGLSWGSYLHPDQAEAYIDEFFVAQRERRLFHQRVQMRRHDGEWRWIESFAQPLFGADGVFLGHVGVSPDITKSVEGEESLSKYRSDLENLVLARTAELEKANSDLEKENTRRLETEKERVRLLKQVVTTQEDERRRIARDLHDELGQHLTALRLKIETAKDVCRDEVLSLEIEDMQAMASRLDQEVSFLARELRPAAIGDTTLVEALSAYIKEWARMSTILTEFHSNGLDSIRLEPDVETNLYRIAEEALNNVRKHSRAKNVSVLLEKRRNEITLIIEDDGVAFDPDAQPKRTEGLGLIGMRERAALLEGSIEIESALGSGTTVFVRVPNASTRTRQN